MSGPGTLSIAFADDRAVAHIAGCVGDCVHTRGSRLLRTEGSTDLGPVTQQRSIVLALTPSDPAGLRAFDSQAGRSPLAPHQFATRFGPSPTSVAAVGSWARAQGLTVTSVSPDGLLMRVAGSTSVLGAALGVTFHRFRAADGSQYISSTGEAALPASLAGKVSAIIGLSDLARTHGYLTHPAAAALPGVTYPTSYGPRNSGPCTTRRRRRRARASRSR